MNTQTVTVNLVPGLSTPAVVKVSQGDIGRPLAFKVLDGTNVASLGAMVTTTIVGTKPSGLGFSVVGTLDGNIVTLDTTLAMTQECGMIPAEIRFTTSTPATVIGTANFILAVEPSPHPDGTTDGTYETMGDLQSQLNALDTRVDALEAGGGGSGLTDDIKTALLNCFAHVAWVDADGQDYYDALESALDSGDLSVSLTLSQVSSSNTATSVGYGESYTTTLTASTGYTLNTVSVTMGGVDITSTSYSSGTVSIPSVTGNIVITATAVLAAQSITATYTQSGTVYETDTLDSLKTDLVVTANYSGGTSETVPASDYTLSGTLTVGTSTITVTYAGLTTTFSVTVTSAPVSYLYNWDFTQSLVDSVEGQEVTLGAGSGVSNATRDSSGLSFNAATQYAYLGEISPVGKTFEIDVSSFDFKGSTSYHIRFLSNSQYASSTSKGLGAIVWRKDTNQGWTSYGWNSETSQTAAWSASLWNSNLAGSSSSVLNAFSAKTVKIVYHSDGHTKDTYLDNDFIGTISDVWFNEYGSVHHSDKIYIGGQMSVNQGSGDQCYDMTITGIRIYENNE